jgi:hypothetical protein
MYVMKSSTSCPSYSLSPLTSENKHTCTLQHSKRDPRKQQKELIIMNENSKLIKKIAEVMRSTEFILNSHLLN